MSLKLFKLMEITCSWMSTKDNGRVHTTTDKIRADWVIFSLNPDVTQYKLYVDVNILWAAMEEGRQLTVGLTKEHKQQLEAAFRKTIYPDNAMISTLARNLKIDRNLVKRWFADRETRMMQTPVSNMERVHLVPKFIPCNASRSRPYKTVLVRIPSPTRNQSVCTDSPVDILEGSPASNGENCFPMTGENTDLITINYKDYLGDEYEPSDMCDTTNASTISVKSFHDFSANTCSDIRSNNTMEQSSGATICQQQGTSGFEFKSSTPIYETRPSFEFDNTNIQCALMSQNQVTSKNLENAETTLESNLIYHCEPSCSMDDVISDNRSATTVEQNCDQITVTNFPIQECSSTNNTSLYTTNDFNNINVETSHSPTFVQHVTEQYVGEAYQVNHRQGKTFKEGEIRQKGNSLSANYHNPQSHSATQTTTFSSNSTQTSCMPLTSVRKKASTSNFCGCECKSSKDKSIAFLPSHTVQTYMPFLTHMPILSTPIAVVPIDQMIGKIWNNLACQSVVLPSTTEACSCNHE